MAEYDFSALISAIGGHATTLAGTAEAKDLVFLSKAVETLANTYNLKAGSNLYDLLDKAQSRVNLGLPIDIATPLAGQILAYDGVAERFVNTAPPKGFNYLTRDPITTDVQFVIGDVVINTANGSTWICVAENDGTLLPRGFYSTQGNSIGLPQGQFLANTSLNNLTVDNGATNVSFVVPAQVTTLCAVLVGAGGGGHPDWSNDAGGGGALAWANDIPVTPGETLTLQVQLSGTPYSQNGSATKLIRGATTLFEAQGGKYNASALADIAAPVAGTITPGNIGSGRGGLTSTNGYGGGGGAGGYSGNGGNGYYSSTGNPNNTFNNTINGTGGAAAGGTSTGSSTYGAWGGGGVGLHGQGASGTSDPATTGNTWRYTFSDRPATGGSGGERGAPHSNTTTISDTESFGTELSGMASTQEGGKPTGTRNRSHGQGGAFGGGGCGGGTSVSIVASHNAGGCGGARIIWGAGRAFPSTKTYDVPEVSF